MPSSSTGKPAQVGQPYAPGRQLDPAGGWQDRPMGMPQAPQQGWSSQPFMPNWLSMGAPLSPGGPLASPQMRSPIQINPQSGEWEPVGGWPPGMAPVKPPEPVPQYVPFEINA